MARVSQTATFTGFYTVLTFMVIHHAAHLEAGCGSWPSWRQLGTSVSLQDHAPREGSGELNRQNQPSSEANHSVAQIISLLPIYNQVMTSYDTYLSI